MAEQQAATYNSAEAMTMLQGMSASQLEELVKLQQSKETSSASMGAKQEKRLSEEPDRRPRKRADRSQEKDPEDEASNWRDAVNEESEKRRDLKEEVRAVEDEVQTLQHITDKLKWTTIRITESLIKDAEVIAGRLILIVKKKQLSMREFYSKYKDFQKTMGQKSEVQEIYSQGPIWGVKVKYEDATMGVQDRIKDYVAKELNSSAAVFKGKTALANMKEAAIKQSYTTLLTMWSLTSQGAREMGLRTQWPDNQGCWSIVKGGSNLIRGRINLELLEVAIEVNDETLGKRGDEFITKLLEANRNARDKSLCMLECTKAARLSSAEVWGKPGKS